MTASGNGRTARTHAHAHAHEGGFGYQPGITAMPHTCMGVHFKSRLEARWAIFFQTAGIEWQYEPRRFRIESVRGVYTPDFFLPGMDLWVEVKPEEQFADFVLLSDFVQSSGKRIALLTGYPSVDPVCAYRASVFSLEQFDDGKAVVIDWGATVFVQCRRCGAFGLEDAGMHVEGEVCSGAGWGFCCTERAGWFGTKALNTAFAAAAGMVAV
jgi:hypothetical protein